MRQMENGLSQHRHRHAGDSEGVEQTLEEGFPALQFLARSFSPARKQYLSVAPLQREMRLAVGKN
jgi:hypothetical protein